jgi:hypothetical protein
MKKTKAYFIQHCDHPNCDLGSFAYTCPYCDKVIDDYKIWWKEDEIYKGNSHNFNCKNCEKELVVKWNKKKYTFEVSLIKK